MKNSILKMGGIFALAILLSGCFETKFNFKTTVDESGKIKREVQINERGARRFLPPAGPAWKVTTSEMQGTESIFEDTHYDTKAVGGFKQTSQFTSDFNYDTSKLLAGITEEKEKMMTEIGIPKPFDKQIKTYNAIELKRQSHLFYTEYHYQETFRLRWIIPLLVYDLKNELLRQEDLNLNNSQLEVNSPNPVKVNSDMVAPEKIEALAQQELVEKILPKFSFHSEVTLPGKITASNAGRVNGHTGIWDFKASDFTGHYSTYELNIISKAFNKRLLYYASGILFLVTAGLAGFFIFRKRSTVQKTKPKKSS